MRTLITLLLLISATPAFADDSGASGDLQKLLDNLPTVQTKEAPPPEKEKVEEEDAVDLPTYMAEIRNAIFANWTLSPKAAAKDPRLSCQLLVKVNNDGTFGDVVMIQPSGNKKFDKLAGDAVFATPGVTPPPVSLAAAVGAGVPVTFVAAQKIPR